MHLPTVVSYDSAWSCEDNTAFKEEKIYIPEQNVVVCYLMTFTSINCSKSWSFYRVSIWFHLNNQRCKQLPSGLNRFSHLEISGSVLFQMAWAGSEGRSARGCRQRAGTQTWTQTMSGFFFFFLKKQTTVRQQHVLNSLCATTGLPLGLQA